MRRRWFALLLFASAVSSAAAAEVRLDLGSATVAQPGAVARVCLSLATGGADVAGTQNDLVWDGTCATLPSEGACAAAGTHGKQLSARIQGSEDFRLRALILSLTDVDPIDDGVLYCCDFTVDAAPGACCAVTVDNAGASDSRGNRVQVATGSGQLCVASDSSATPTPTRTPTPPPAATDDDGCQAAPAGRASAAPWLAALALLLARRRR